MDLHNNNSDSFNRGQIEVLESIAKGMPLLELLDRIVRLVESRGPHLICSILLLDSPSGCLRHGASPKLPEEYSRAIDGVRAVIVTSPDESLKRLTEQSKLQIDMQWL